jgi:uncharacterized protein (DUF488 family)
LKTHKIWTIGTSNRPLKDFLALLAKYQIETLVDCRTYPRSRWSPQYNSKSLLEATNLAGISYELQSEHLGGLKPNVDYQETIDEYVQRAKAGERIAVTCSEASPDKCHRKSMLTPSFVASGLEVHHILWSGGEIVDSGLEPVQQML